MHEQSLAGLQSPTLERVVPDGEEGFGNCRGGNQCEAFRHRQRVAFMRPTIFGVTAADHQRHDLVARLPALHADPQRNHFARDLKTGDIGSTGGW